MTESNESNNNNLYALCAFLLLILVGAAYARVPAFREIADAKAPWFKENVGHYLVGAGTGGDAQKSGGDAQAPGGDPSDPNGVGEKPGFDLAIFSAHPESWPKTIKIKAETQFPAVINDKKVGTVRAPAGSDVHLIKVENGKLGVEFRGGGTWVAPEATDLIERFQDRVPSSPAPRP